MPAKPFGRFTHCTTRCLAALLLVLIVLAALGAQFWLDGSRTGLEPRGIRARDLMRYFTILTCGLIAALMAQEAMGRPASGNWQATAILNIVMVGVIFQILLAPPEPVQGLAWWPDFAFRAAIPVLTLGRWPIASTP